jgi:hypothetical protein
LFKGRLGIIHFYKIAAEQLSMMINLRISKIRRKVEFESGCGEPLQIRWNMRMKSNFYGFISRTEEFSQ